jgi:hypothetical protein
MKLSVSVPDDLWDQARGQAPTDIASAPSALVQEALRAYVTANAPEAPRLRVPRPEGHQVTFERARSKLAQQARQEAEKGYVAGLAIAEHLEWHDIESLAERYRFDVAEWAKSYRDADERAAMRKSGMQIEPMHEATPRPNLMRHLIVNLGDLAAFASQAEWDPAPTYLRGVRQALAEMYQEAMAAADGSANSDRKTGGNA